MIKSSCPILFRECIFAAVKDIRANIHRFSDYEAGGLNLNAGHFAQLSMFAPQLLAYSLTAFAVAIMCFVQIAYQFYLYPSVPLPFILSKTLY